MREFSPISTICYIVKCLQELKDGVHFYQVKVCHHCNRIWRALTIFFLKKLKIRRMLARTCLTSGKHVTICFSGGKSLWYLNLTSPAFTNSQYRALIKSLYPKKKLDLPKNVWIFYRYSWYQNHSWPLYIQKIPVRSCHKSMRATLILV